MFLKEVGMDRKELLRQIVDDLIYTKSNYSNTLLGEPKEITYAAGVLHGVCMALGLEYKIKDKEITFNTFASKKIIAVFPFNPDKPW